MNKYYKVIAKGGHRGRSKCGELVFYVKAPDAYVAMQKAKRFPAVKHHRETPFSVVEVDEATYIEGKKQNAYENYFPVNYDKRER